MTENFEKFVLEETLSHFLPIYEPKSFNSDSLMWKYIFTIDLNDHMN